MHNSATADMRTDVPREAWRQGSLKWLVSSGRHRSCYAHSVELPCSSPSLSKRKALSPPLPCQMVGSVLWKMRSALVQSLEQHATHFVSLLRHKPLAKSRSK